MMRMFGGRDPADDDKAKVSFPGKEVDDLHSLGMMDSRSELTPFWYAQQDDSLDSKYECQRIDKQILRLYIQEEMKKHESMYTTFRDIKIWLGTWNVNGKKIEENISVWLTGSATGRPEYDIYVIGLQEMVDLSASSIVSESQSVKRAAVWIDMISESLNKKSTSENSTYVLVDQKLLVGVFLCVFIRKSYEKHVKAVRSTTTATGFLGVMGNKGAAAIRMSLFDSTVCFVCSHFTAHRENVAGRNAEWQKIMESVNFRAPDHAYEDISILSHDFVFWVGDLNYRITSDVSTDAVFDLAYKDFRSLIKKDQLRVSQRAGLVFDGFIEPEINFPPTYKYKRFSDEYNRGGKKIRAPAWCDRVLYSAKENDDVNVISYDHIPKMMSSDHKPVFSIMGTRLKEYANEKKRDILSKIETELKQFEDPKASPCIELDTQVLEFGELKYLSTRTLSLTLTNTGSVNAFFRFLLNPETKQISKRFFSISRPFGMLLPSRSITIDITVTIDNENVIDLATGRDSLDDVITLRTDSDKGLFIRLSGKYLQSCFGQSLDALIRMKSAARDCDTVSLSAPIAMNVPKELWRMVDFIFNNCAYVTGMWSEPSGEYEKEQVRDALDEGVEFDDARPLAMAECMIDWFASLAQPLIPEKCTNAMEKGKIMDLETAKTFVSMLPSVNRNVFSYIVLFLREMLKFSNSNNLSVPVIASTFARAFVSRQKNSSSSQAHKLSIDIVNDLLVFYLNNGNQPTIIGTMSERKLSAQEDVDSGSDDSDDN